MIGFYLIINLIISFLLYNLIFTKISNWIKIVLITLVVNSISIYLIIKISPLFILSIEVFISIFLINFKILEKDKTYLVIFKIFIGASLIFCSIFLINCETSIIILFLIICFKVVATGMFILLFSNRKHICREGLIIYLLTSKIFICMYGFLLKKINYKELILEGIFLENVTIIVGVWILLVIINILLLIFKDIEGYFLNLLNLSQYLLLLTCFFSIKKFFIGLFIDIIILTLIIYTLELKIKPIQKPLGKWSGVFVFLIIKHLVGIPPFPSFFIEMFFIFFVFIVLKGVIKFLFLTIIFLLLITQLSMLFKRLGGLINNPKYYLDLRYQIQVVSINILGVFVSLWFQFFIICK